MNTPINKILNFLNQIWGYAQAHKIRSAIILIILIIAGYFGYNYFFNKKTTETRYILTSVTKGTIQTTISGTGQIEPKEEKTVKTEASGKITYLNSNVMAGAEISKGTLIATIDSSDAKEAIENAEDSLETAQIALDKLMGTEKSNPKVVQEAEEDLAKSYEDGYNTVSSVFLDLPNIMKNLNDILYGTTFNRYQQNIDYYSYGVDHQGKDKEILVFRESVIDSYEKARSAYDKNFTNYKASDIYSTDKEIDSLISETYETSKLISQSIKDAINLIQFYEDVLTNHNIDVEDEVATHISSLSSYLGNVNSDVSSLFNTKSTIENNIDAIDDTDDEIRTAELNVKSKKATLQNAKDDLNNCYIYANLTGIISSINITSGENVSSGTSVVTIITNSKIASITLSETDIVGIKVGNKAIVTFDAIEELEIEGNVLQVDASGSTNSGVVSYGIEIAFDTDNENVKPGMSVSATVVKDSKENVLILPTTAVKENNNGTYYVQVLDEKYDLTNKSLSIKGVNSKTLPTTKIVEVGLSDDANTEIISGLEEGDQIVLRISSGATSSTTSNSFTTKTSNSNNMLRGATGGGGPPGM